MRHSSSWPDRSPQTVKVRLDPLSRAFTIIPTIREGFHPFLAATKSAPWIDEIVLLDHGGCTSVETKRRFVDEARIVRANDRGKLGETFELRTFVPNVMNRSCRRDIGETGLPRGVSSSEAAIDCRGRNGNTSEGSGPEFLVANEGPRLILGERISDGKLDGSGEFSKLLIRQTLNVLEGTRAEVKVENEDSLPVENVARTETPEHGWDALELAAGTLPETIPRIKALNYDDIRCLNKYEDSKVDVKVENEYSLPPETTVQVEASKHPGYKIEDAASSQGTTPRREVATPHIQVLTYDYTASMNEHEHSRVGIKAGNEDSLVVETIVQIETPKHNEARPEDAPSSRESTPGKQTAATHNHILDYDYLTSSRAEWVKAQHACPKCTSEGLLQQRVDPFGPAVSSKKSNVVRDSRCRVTEKPEALRKYSTAEAKMRNSWQRIGGRGLIGSARNRDKGGVRCGLARNGEAARRGATETRKETTLRRHYYPEGGWGYVIVTCSALVHFLGIGLQLAAPGSWYLTAELKFHQPPLHSAGKPIPDLERSPPSFNASPG